MDNRVFNVNGKGDELLLATLKLVASQVGSNTKFKGWYFNPKKGLVLTWYNDFKRCNVFLSDDGLIAEHVLPMVSTWLKSKEAKSMKLTGWDADLDHDGSNSMGWRVYCEDWGHIEDDHYTICAVTPANMWYGK